MTTHVKRASRGTEREKEGTEEAHSARNEAMEVVQIPLGDIRSSPLNPRKEVDEEHLKELAESIRQLGVIQPIHVRPLEGDGGYEVGPGRSRYLACVMADLEIVPAIIHEGVDDATWLRMMLVENLQRRDLNAIEEAEGYKKLEELGVKQQTIGKAINRSQPVVSNRVRLLGLPEAVQGNIRRGELTPAHGVALARYSKFPQVAEAIAEQAVKHGLTTHKIEKIGACAYELEQKGFIKEVAGYRCKFDTEICTKCPHDAYRKGQYTHYCLNPSCYDELQEKAERERREALERKSEELTQGGQELLKIEDLEYGTYQRLDTHDGPPEGCREDCDKRRVALDHHDEETIICIDLSCYKKLKVAQTKRENKAREEAGKEMLAKAREKIDGLTEIGYQEVTVLAMLVIGAISGYSSSATEVLWEALERQGLGETAKTLKAMSTWDVREKGHQALLWAPSLDLVKAVLEATLNSRIECAYGQYGSGLDEWIPWYLGIEQAQEEEKEEVPPEAREEDS
jgi:ParB/RepB/Spo0J family partition protein